MTYQAGQKLGNYQLVRPLGRGGFAEVYLGKHIYLNTQAAIKVLKLQLIDETLEKFLHEARIIASLEHPHIVRVLEFGIEEQRPFLVMSYAPHGTLRRRSSVDGVLAPVAILPYVKQIATALQYAHERKIIHRDVKPENMLLDANNTVLLSDFGLAIEARSSYYMQSTDSAGTTCYMSPEQLRGKPCAASDQYALAVVMYEWLCGSLPFDGPDISIVVQHLHEPPPSLREQVPTISTAVENVILRALEKEPQKRFSSVLAFVEAFAEACKDEPVSTYTNKGTLLPAMDMYKPDNGALHPSLSIDFADLPREPVSSEPAKDVHIVSIGRTFFGQGNFPVSDGAGQNRSNNSISVPSLPASLLFSRSSLEATTVEESTAISPPQKRPRVSRRVVLAGLAGLGMVLGGAGIWGLSSMGHGASTPTTPGTSRVGGNATGGGQTAGTVGKGGTPTSPGSGNGGSLTGGNTNGTGTSLRKNGSTGSTTPASGSTPTGTSAANTPGSTSTAAPTTGSTPTATPTVTLTIQISVPSSVQNNGVITTNIITNKPAIHFDLTAAFYPTGQGQSTMNYSVTGNSTDSSGRATVSKQIWHIPPGQLKKMSNPVIVLQAIGTDTNGTVVNSSTATVQVVP